MHKQGHKPATLAETLRERFAEILGLVLLLGWVAFLVLHKILHVI
jgi:hypothetical protein